MVKGFEEGLCNEGIMRRGAENREREAEEGLCVRVGVSSLASALSKRVNNKDCERSALKHS